jgi:hypothetical protein
MTVAADLLTRIKVFYIEMPTLKLTVRQACRLWQLDAELASSCLGRLVHERFLAQTGDGQFVRPGVIQPASVAE